MMINIILSIIIIILLILIIFLITSICLKKKYKNNRWNYKNLKRYFKRYNTLKKKKIGYPIFYINLDRSIKRRKNMEKQLSLISDNYKRISAVDGNKIVNSKYGKVDGVKYINYFNKFSNNNELGCTLSHIKAIKKAYQLGLNKVLILEDDVIFYLMPFWETNIPKIVNSSPKNWEIIKLYSGKNTGAPNTFIRDYINNRTWGTVAYIINRKGMEKILDHTLYKNSDTINLIVDNIPSKSAIADNFLYDIAITYSYGTPLFLLGDNFLPSTIHKNHTKLHNNYTKKNLNYYSNFKWNLNNKISIVIPCIPRDIKYLNRLLNSINNQIYKPYEIIIAMSGLNNIDAVNLQNNIKYYYPKLNLIINNTREKKLASVNRNRGGKLATGNIITFMDADDKMHPKKLYYINKLFNEYNPLALVHSFSKNYGNFEEIPKNIKIVNGEKIYDKILKRDGQIKYGKDRIWCIPKAAHGHITIDSSVLNNINYIESEIFRIGEDAKFIRDIIDYYGRKSHTIIFADIPLSQYIPSEKQNIQNF